MLLMATLYSHASDASTMRPDLHKVFFLDVQHGYALGSLPEAEIVFKTSDGGKSWVAVYQRKPALIGIYFRNPDQGWIVGREGSILSTIDGGKTWSDLASGTDQDLLAIASNSDREIFVVGRRGTFLKSDRNGKTWFKQAVPTVVDLTDVALLPNGLLQVLGRDRLLTSADFGTTWITHGPYRWDTLFELAVVNEKTIFLNSSALLQTRDGGNTLHLVHLPSNEYVARVWVTDVKTEYVIVGRVTTGSTIHLSGEKLPSHSSILKTTDDGQTWRQLLHLQDKMTHSAWLKDIFFVGDHGWAVGDEGTIVYTEDAGKTWQRGRIP